MPLVMAGLLPALQVLLATASKDMDARHGPGMPLYVEHGGGSFNESAAPERPRYFTTSTPLASWLKSSKKL